MPGGMRTPGGRIARGEALMRGPLDLIEDGMLAALAGAVSPLAARAHAERVVERAGSGQAAFQEERAAYREERLRERRADQGVGHERRAAQSGDDALPVTDIARVGAQSGI